jgi:hypothetical protein
MTDIVQWLREEVTWEVFKDDPQQDRIDGLNDAANEIERLREELKWSKIEAEQAHMMVDALQKKLERK